MPMPWWVPRPACSWDTETVRAFDRQFAEAVRAGPGVALDYRLDRPKWQFLCYLADTGRVVLHGSDNGAIAEFEPRLAVDVDDFGAQRGVYAAGDGLWAMFFAVIDRARYPGVMLNSCLRFGDPPEPRYFFSLDPRLATHPWRDGWMYLLPSDTFVQQVLDGPVDEPVQSTQYFSPDPVVPIARLAVGPEDFPLLDQVRTHHDDVVLSRAHADPAGFPWVDEQVGVPRPSEDLRPRP